MKKSQLVLVLAAVVIVAIFAVDYWLRANKKFVGGEVIDTPTATPSKQVAPETYETLFARAVAAPTSAERARQLMALDASVAAKSDADAMTKRRAILDEVIKTCSDQLAFAHAVVNLAKFAADDKNESALLQTVPHFTAAVERFGIHETAITSWHFEMMFKALGEKHRDIVDKLQAMIDSPHLYGPEDIREINRFRFGMKLKGDMFTPAEKIDQVVKFRRQNLTKKSVTEDVVWHGGAQETWQVEPLEAHLTLAPGEEKTLEFRARFDRAKGDMLPLPSLKSVITREGEKPTEQLARMPVDTRNYRDWRVSHCVRVAKAPAIDGTLDDEAWAKCKPSTLHVAHDGFTRAPNDTLVYTCYDDKGLYVAMRVLEDDMANIRVTEVPRDGDVCKDDSVEMMLNPNSPW